jgi:two-component system, OmpR family, sensor histidine kinase MprB
VTFRSRVITATVAAAAIAVLLACFASFLTTRNSLIHSVDESLSAESTQMRSNGTLIHIGSFLILPSGQVVGNGASGIHVDTTLLDVAKGKSPAIYRTVSIGSNNYRELIVPLPANTVGTCPGGNQCIVKTTSAELFITDIDGQVNELRSLIRTLAFVAIGGLLLALGLGLFLARTALRPLEQVTNEIETVAETNDLGYRLTEGDDDELGRLRRVFNRLLSTVESSQILQRQLVVDASHELRTPLTSLRTNAQVLSRAQELNPDDLRQLTDDMVTQVDELASLVTDLGELSRGERSEGAVETLRLDECLDECVDTARTYARIKEITIDVHVESSNVLGRRDRLERAISNLLTNAIKFTPQGGRILVDSHAGTISVSDSGPGIDEADLPFIFDRFWRSASARSLPGSGLGLSIVAQVVAELQGSVSVDRDPILGGARFTITLPMADNPVA